jgi:hypothetical protein
MEIGSITKSLWLTSIFYWLTIQPLLAEPLDPHVPTQVRIQPIKDDPNVSNAFRSFFSSL